MTSLSSTLSDHQNQAQQRSSTKNETFTTLYGSVIGPSDLESQVESIVESMTDETSDRPCVRISETENATASPAWPRPSNADWNKDKPVVVIRGACKSYGSKKSPNVVLCKLNMTLREGSM